MPSQRKIDLVKNLSEKLSRAQSIILADYRGLSHKQMEEIKKNLKKVSGEFLVAKNTLLAKSFLASHIQLPTSTSNFQLPTSNFQFTGPTAILFSYADEIAPLKELYKFIKNLSLPKIKFGILGQQFLEAQDMERLAKLPTREVLLTQLVETMQVPVLGLHRALSWNLQKLVWVLKEVKARR